MTFETRIEPGHRDFSGYAGTPPDPRWPGGAKVALSFVINFEEGAELAVSEGDARNEGVYEVDHRIEGPDPCVESHFEFHWHLNRQIGWFGTAKDSIDIKSATTNYILEVWPI